MKDPKIDAVEAAAMEVVTYCTTQASRFVKLNEVEAIIRSAIDKALPRPSDGRVNRVKPCHSANKDAASGQEWTVEYVDTLLDKVAPALAIVSAHNASLAAVKDSSTVWRIKESKDEEILRLDKELAAAVDALDRVLIAHTQAEKDDAIHYVRAALATWITPPKP